MADPFEQDTLTLRRKMLGKKNEMQRLGTIPSRQKSEFKEEIIEFQQKIDELESLVQQYERNPNKYNLTNNQLNSRKSDLQELVNLKISLEEILNGVSMNQAQKNLFNGANEQRTFANQHAPPTASTEQVYSSYQQQKMEQDRRLDQLNEGTQRIKHVAIKIGHEVDDHNDKLEDLELGIDSNTSGMVKTTQKMQKLIKESSTCGILVTIFVEIAILVLIIIYM